MFTNNNSYALQNLCFFILSCYTAKCSCLDEVGLAVTQPLIECKLGILTSWLSKVNKSLCLPWFDDVKKHILTPDPLGNCDGETKLSMPRRADGETRALDQQQSK